MTPAMWSAARVALGTAKAIHLLLSRGADVNVRASIGTEGGQYLSSTSG